MTNPQAPDAELAARDILADEASKEGCHPSFVKSLRNGRLGDHDATGRWAVNAMLAFAALRDRPTEGGVERALLMARSWIRGHSEACLSKIPPDCEDGPYNACSCDYPSRLKVIDAALASLQAGEAAPVVEGDLRKAAIAARDQFTFYAREHAAAGKTEKAATNKRFADMLDATLSTPAKPNQTAQGVER